MPLQHYSTMSDDDSSTYKVLLVHHHKRGVSYCLQIFQTRFLTLKNFRTFWAQITNLLNLVSIFESKADLNLNDNYITSGKLTGRASNIHSALIIGTCALRKRTKMLCLLIGLMYFSRLLTNTFHHVNLEIQMSTHRLTTNCWIWLK